MRVKEIETKLQKAIALGHLYFKQKLVEKEIEIMRRSDNADIHDELWRATRNQYRWYFCTPWAIMGYLTGGRHQERQIEPLQRLIKKTFERERGYELVVHCEFSGDSIQYSGINLVQWGAVSRNQDGRDVILQYEFTMSPEFERALLEVFGRPKMSVLRDMVECSNNSNYYRQLRYNFFK
jgi:hypothetical protein